MKKLTDKEMYAVICSDAKYAPRDKVNILICGIYATRREARRAAEDIKECPLPHTIVRGKVEFIPYKKI